MNAGKFGGSFVFWALLSALFAGMTAILAKKGVQDVPSNLAMTIRVAVVLVFAASIAFATGQTGVKEINGKTWLFLTLSGIATGASWLCYFRALQLGPVTKVAPIDKLSFVLAMILGVVVLHEKPNVNVVLGGILVVAGVLLTLKP